MAVVATRSMAVRSLQATQGGTQARRNQRDDSTADSTCKTHPLLAGITEGSGFQPGDSWEAKQFFGIGLRPLQVVGQYGTSQSKHFQVSATAATKHLPSRFQYQAEVDRLMDIDNPPHIPHRFFQLPAEDKFGFGSVLIPRPKTLTIEIMGFLVADRVTVITKNNNDPDAWEWESSAGNHSYTVRKAEGADLKRGTRVILHLKEDTAEMSDSKRFVFAVQWSASGSYQEGSGVGGERWEALGARESRHCFCQEAESCRVVWGLSVDFRLMGEHCAYSGYWSFAVVVVVAYQVSKEDYDNFFKMTFREFVEPLGVAHFNVEGTIEFSAMLFVPGMAPFEQTVYALSKHRGHVVPTLLLLVYGIRAWRWLVERLESTLAKTLCQNLASPQGFVGMGVWGWGWGGKALADLLRFPSSKSGDSAASLPEYVSRMKEGQKDIYYIAADTLDAASSAPFVEQLIKKDIEVFYLTEPIDEPALNSLSVVPEKKFVGRHSGRIGLRWRH
eukprot:jgi/Botrbrau1/2992/Bobra.0026s0052.1